MTPEITEIFEKFLNEELSPEEVNQFNQKLQDDTVFANEFNSYKKIHELPGINKYINFKKQLKGIHNEYTNKQKKPKILLWRVVPAAASVLILLTVVYFLWLAGGVNSQKDTLFSVYNPKFISLKTNVINQDLADAVLAYKNKNFDKAVELFKKLSDSDPLETSFKFNLAMSFMGNKKFNEATVLFEELMAIPNSVFKEKAEWYLAVLFYNTNNYKKAKNIFKSIANNPAHYKSQDAKKALEIIDEETK